METTKATSELPEDGPLTPQLEEFIRSFLVPLLVRRYLEKVEGGGERTALPEAND